MNIRDGGTATAIVEDGGFVSVSEEGTAAFASHTLTGFIYGSASVHDNTVASDVQVGVGGTLTLFAGGLVPGPLDIIGDGAVVASGGAIIDFAVAGQTAGGATLVSNFNRITDAGAIYTITVKTDQAAGEYALANGAAGFDKTITVKTAESELGTITVGKTLTVGNTGYTLNKVDDLLSLTIADLTAPPVVENTTTAEIILTISDANHPSFGATGGWKVQTDQTVVWQDLSTLSGDFQILGQGYTVAGKAMTDIYVYSASAKYVGAYAAALNGLDMLTFTAGVGENGPITRAGICKYLSFMGVKLDPEANEVHGKERCISTPDSSVQVWVIPTNEELMIAQDTAALCEK